MSNKEIIKGTINTYYGYRTLYESFSGDILVMPALNEFYHVSTMFDNCIADICKNIDKINSNNFVYTGWNIVNKQCRKENNEHIGIPIYIRNFDDNESDDMLSIVDRTISPNKVLVTINTLFDRTSTIEYDLHHELFHALQMYIGDKNYIENQKTRINIDEEQDIICRLRLTSTLLNDFNSILYYSSESEQNAQINATIPFLKNKNIKRDKKTVNNIISLIDQSEDLNCFYKYQFYFEKFYNWWMSTNVNMINNIYVLGYFYKKYSGDKNVRKIKISKQDILNIKNIEYDEKHKQCWIIVGIISDKFEVYKKRLYDTIVTHCLIN